MPFECPFPLEDLLDPLAPLRAGERMAEIGGDALLGAVKDRTPVYHGWDTEDRGRKPGTLRDSVVRDRVRPHRGSFSGWEVLVFTLDPIAQFVEWDTKPHLIVPKPPGTALRFYTEQGPVFATVVHHPGTTGQHMFSRGAFYVSLSASELLQPELEAFAKELVTV